MVFGIADAKANGLYDSAVREQCEGGCNRECSFSYAQVYSKCTLLYSTIFIENKPKQSHILQVYLNGFE